VSVGHGIFVSYAFHFLGSGTQPKVAVTGTRGYAGDLRHHLPVNSDTTRDREMLEQANFDTTEMAVVLVQGEDRVAFGVTDR
jgi:hypothetical protein